MTIFLNLNTEVTVRLTPYGREKVLACDWVIASKVPPAGEPYTEQLWVLMNALGPSMGMGSDMVFVGNAIEIDEADWLRIWDLAREVVLCAPPLVKNPPPSAAPEPGPTEPVWSRINGTVYAPGVALSAKDQAFVDDVFAGRVVPPLTDGPVPAPAPSTFHVTEVGFCDPSDAAGFAPAVHLSAHTASVDLTPEETERFKGYFPFLESAPASPQGREDLPYDRGFADGKKQGVAKVQARLAAAEALAKAVEAWLDDWDTEGSVALSEALSAYRSAP